MSVILAIVGLLLTGSGAVLMGLEQSPDYAPMLFFIGIIVLISGAIVANREGRKSG